MQNDDSCFVVSVSTLVDEGGEQGESPGDKQLSGW